MAKGLGKLWRRGGKRGPGAKAGSGVMDALSPNPATSLVLADIAMRGGERLLRHGVEKTLLKSKYPDDKAKKAVEGRSLKQLVLGAVLSRVATSSVPGALIVGGGMLAKTLYDRGKGRGEAEAEGDKRIARQARRDW